MSTYENKEDAFVAVEYVACECGETFVDAESFDIHFREKHTQISQRPPTQPTQAIVDYKCGECGQLYPTEEACVQHQEVDHLPYMEDMSQGEEDDEEGSVSTEVIVPEIINFETELKIEHIEHEITPKPKKKRDQRKKVQCEICGKHYSSTAALWYHRKVHLDVKPFKCQYCPKAFTLKLYWQMHERIHTGEKPYQCASCPKAFSNRGALLRHDLIHTGLKPYTCPKCQKSFTQSNAMKLHYHTVHLKLPTPYKSYKANRNQNRAVKQGDSHDQFVLPELVAPAEGNEDVCYIETPAGRTIALKTIVPKKMKEQLASLQSQKDQEETEDQQTEILIEAKIEPKEEYYYCGEEVAYEVVYQ